MSLSLRKLSVLCCLSAMFAGALSAQTTLAKWTFEGTTATGTGTTYTYGVADSGALITGSSASGVHAGSTTTWSSPVGNASAKSFSSNTWAVGGYYQFVASTIGYQSISVSWDQGSSGTGPTSFSLAYSTDGSSFTTFANYTVKTFSGTNITFSDTTTGSAWTSSKTAVNTASVYDLVTATALDNASLVYFRLVNGSSPTSAGTDRVDNFTITAASTVSAVPEPSTYAAVCGGLMLVGSIFLRTRGARGKTAPTA